MIFHLVDSHEIDLKSGIQKLEECDYFPAYYEISIKFMNFQMMSGLLKTPLSPLFAK